MSAENIILNSCQYTPIYFIENPGVSQARSYVLTQNNQTAEKPVGENLKRFYENSGKLESNLNIAESINRPKIIKKQENNVIGNNLKLASFLLPKCETKNELFKPIIAPVNNVILKPVYIANNLSVNNVNSSSQVPKLDVNSRIVKLKDLPNIVRSQNGKILPKIKPKENTCSTSLNKLKPTAVQLVKLGETYHSLDQLSNDQMKIVNRTLQMFSNSQPSLPEPVPEPASNTKFIYKVVSQKELLVADKNKVNKQIIPDNIRKETIKVEKPEIVDEEPKVNIETKVTRSGRVVKLPKNIILDDSPTKPKRKNSSIVTCLQCTSKFSSPQRLHRHYENHPSHLPIKLHNNLFHCLMSIVSASPETDKATILIHQLELLIEKLRSCMPCLLKTAESANGNQNLINEDISKLLGVKSGKYNLNMDALGCEKDKDGYCSHNPKPPLVTCTENIKPHILLIENTENCINKGPGNISKTNFFERRPTILRKVECRKQKLEQNNSINGKKIKLSQDTDTNTNSIGIDDIVALLSDTAKTENNLETPIDKTVITNQQNDIKDTAPERVVTKPPHIQFHSTHFDIRSSPIKPTSTVFRKFQINPEKMAKYEIEIIRPIQLNQLAQDVEMRTDNNLNTQDVLFGDTNTSTSKESEHITRLCHENWSCEDPPGFTKPNDLMNESDNFMKSHDLIEPSLLYVKNATKIANEVTNDKDVMKSNISIELAQDNHTVSDDKDIIQTDDFMKSDILIEQALLLAQNDYKLTEKINDQANEFMKSNILIEPTLLPCENNEKVLDNFTDETHHYNSQAHVSTISNANDKVAGVTGNNDIDMDLTTNHGQSIMSFLESLGNELAYSETDTRNNSVDFQLDLFSFNSS